MEGQGTFTSPDGRKEVGEFKEDQPWDITVYDKEGTTIEKFVKGVEQK